MNNRPRPKFCVGEEVRVQSIYDSKFDVDRAEVTVVKWSKKSRHSKDSPLMRDSWIYQTDHVPKDDLYWNERSLHKIDQDGENTFECLMNKLTVPAEERVTAKPFVREGEEA